MFSKLKLKIFIAFMVFATVSVSASALYVPTNRDTSLPPESITYTVDEPTMMNKLWENDRYTYYFRDERDVLAIYDKVAGHTYYSGLDIPTSDEVEEVCEPYVEIYEDGPIGMYEESLEVLKFTLDAEYDELEDKTTVSDSKETLDALYELKDRNDIMGYVTVMNQIDSAIEQYYQKLILVVSDNAELVEKHVKMNTDKTSATDETGEIPYDKVLSDIKNNCADTENRMNTTATSQANSIVTISYFVPGNVIKTSNLASTSEGDVKSTLKAINGTEDKSDHWVLDIKYSKIDISIKLHMHFNDKGVEFEIRDSEITGDDHNRLEKIYIAKYLGAKGGETKPYDLNTFDFSDEIINNKPMNDGYALIPDGPGALVRFRDQIENINSYNARIYGEDVGMSERTSSTELLYVAPKTASLPVFGISEGNGTQRGFVAYGTSGTEYMGVYSDVYQNRMRYNITSSEFIYNQKYDYIYGVGESEKFIKINETRHRYDAKIQYEFLSGDGSVDGKPADYVGMAKAYREHLIEEGMLTENKVSSNEIPIRIDFLMADSKKNLYGYDLKVVTDTDGVENILNDIKGNGISNINSGLMGWQDGGLTIASAGKTDFSRNIGTKSQFEKLVSEFANDNIDISLQQNYTTINEEQMRLSGNALKHANGRYFEHYTNKTVVDTEYYAKTSNSVKWFNNHVNSFSSMNMQSITVDGLSNQLYGNYHDGISRTESKNMIVDSFVNNNDNIKINAIMPNDYLFSSVDRYLQTPLFNTQYLVSTDTVPFLQLVLHNTMEMYAPYTNMSFYTEIDQLRMIDYNVYPSFILTEKPSYHLVGTNSSNFYSTQYSSYDDMIVEVYNNVNGALGAIEGANWLGRKVVENGIVENNYSNGTKIIINYTDDEFDGVPAKSYKVIKT